MVLERTYSGEKMATLGQLFSADMIAQVRGLRDNIRDITRPRYVED